MTSPRDPRPLLLTRDPGTREELSRLAAAAGTDLDVADKPLAALGPWTRAPVVLAGVELADEIAGMQPPRRTGVHLVAMGLVPDHAFRSALAVGAETVVELPASAEWVVELLGEVTEARARGTTLGVVAGCGGAGATTLACALAQVGAGRGPTLLVDADPLGPGLDRLLGLEAEEGVRWESLERTTGRLAARSLRDSVPGRDGLGVLTWGAAVPGTLQAFAAREALAAAQRGHDLVVVDLARQGGALMSELSARCDLLLVVTPATVAGVAATTRVLAHHTDVPARLVLRPGAVARTDVERATGVPVAAELRDQRGLAEAVDLGLGPVRSRRSALGRVARGVLTEVAA